jgi:multiple sugar transport system ATP-binding protein
MLGLLDYLERKPGQLSGGQRQRVAMGRAIIREPSVFLMDEPLSNLDAKLRVQMRADIAALQARLGVTTVYVTHDQSEAMTLGHRVAVLKDGRLQQFESPRTLYTAPANTFVAEFIGSPSMNLCTLPVEHGAVSFGGVDIAIPARARDGHAELVVGLRPEALEIAPDGCGAVVEVVEEIGADTHVFCVAEVGGRTAKLVARIPTQLAPRQGERIRLRPAAAEVHFFDPASGVRLAGSELPAVVGGRM